jgi:hypothetical protein
MVVEDYLLKKVGCNPDKIPSMPISGFEGDNRIERSTWSKPQPRPAPAHTPPELLSATARDPCLSYAHNTPDCTLYASISFLRSAGHPELKLLKRSLRNPRWLLAPRLSALISTRRDPNPKPQPIQLRSPSNQNSTSNSETTLPSSDNPRHPSATPTFSRNNVSAQHKPQRSLHGNLLSPMHTQPRPRTPRSRPRIRSARRAPLTRVKALVRAMDLPRTLKGIPFPRAHSQGALARPPSP